MKTQKVKNNPFDAYARNYQRLLDESIRISGYGQAYFDDYKIREIYAFLRARGLEKLPLRILNFGCGIGKSERFIKKYLPAATVHGVDPSEKSIEMAKASNKDLKNVFFSVLQDFRIPVEGDFAVILVANVLHHIRREDHPTVLRQLKSRLSAQGHLFIFEHNPFNPATARVVRMCPLDEDAVLLSPAYTRALVSDAGFTWITLNFTLFFPGFLSVLRPLEKWLRKLPAGAQYYVIAGSEAGR